MLTEKQALEFFERVKNKKEENKNKCTCDIHTIMNVGCQCGAINKERSIK